MFLGKIFDFGGIFLSGRELFRKWGVLYLYLKVIRGEARETVHPIALWWMATRVQGIELD